MPRYDGGASGANTRLKIINNSLLGRGRRKRGGDRVRGRKKAGTTWGVFVRRER